MFSVTGIILAGGKSSRMGLDKALIIFRGKRLISYSVDLLLKYCQNILISSNDDSLASFGYAVVSDESEGIGPVSGIISALHKSVNPWNIILGCDMPFLDDMLLDRLLRSCQDTLGVIPVHHDQMEPLAALYHAALLPLISEAVADGEFSLQNILRKAPVKCILVDDLLEKKPYLFANLNTPADLDSFANIE